MEAVPDLPQTAAAVNVASAGEAFYAAALGCADEVCDSTGELSLWALENDAGQWRQLDGPGLAEVDAESVGASGTPGGEAVFFVGSATLVISPGDEIRSIEGLNFGAGPSTATTCVRGQQLVSAGAAYIETEVPYSLSPIWQEPTQVALAATSDLKSGPLEWDRVPAVEGKDVPGLDNGICTVSGPLWLSSGVETTFTDQGLVQRAVDTGDLRPEGGRTAPDGSTYVVDKGTNALWRRSPDGEWRSLERDALAVAPMAGRSLVFTTDGRIETL
jgi:hypothetical protein